MKRYMFAIFLLSIFFASGLPLTASASEVYVDYSPTETQTIEGRNDYNLIKGTFGQSSDIGLFYSMITNLPSDCCIVTGYRPNLNRNGYDFGCVIINPDGSYALVSTGSSVWTTDLNFWGVKLKSEFGIGETSIHTSRLKDPSGRYIVFKDQASAAAYAIEKGENTCFISGFDGTNVEFSIVVSSTGEIGGISLNPYSIFYISKSTGFVVDVEYIVPLSVESFEDYQYSGVGDIYNETGICVIAPGVVRKGLYVSLRSWVENRGDIAGNIVCLLSGQNSEYTYLVEQDLSSSTEQLWELYCGSDETAETLTLTFMVDGRPDIYTVYTVFVRDPDTSSEGSSGDVGGGSDDDTIVEDVVDRLPGQITDGMQGILDNERDQIESEGESAVDQIIDIIPDESANFIMAFQNLIDVLSYNGTAAVLTTPAIKIPEVPGMFPEILILEEHQIDFEIYFNMMPDVLIILCRAFFDTAVVYYCFKELQELIGSFSNGFSDMISINGGLYG